MSLFNRQMGSNRGWGVKAPSYDPYGRYQNSTPGVFGYRADNHVVMPGVTSYEAARLESIRDYVYKETGKDCTLSQELINDIYSLHVNGDIKRRPDNGKNSTRHKVLDAVYDSLTKVVTVDSPLFTSILTREMALALQIIDDEIKDEQEKQGQKNGGLESELGGKGQPGEPGEGQGGQGEGEAGGEGQEGEGNPSESQAAGKGEGGQSAKRDQLNEKIIDDALKRAKNDIEKAKERADAKIKDLESQLGAETLKNMSQADPEFLDKLENIREIIQDIHVNKNSMRKVLDKILNESQTYFSTKHTKVEESLFECEECDDLFGLEFLNPLFKHAEILNIGNESRVYKGKFDLYLDCSGSMDSKERFEGRDVNMMNLAKSIAMSLYRMGMIENLYFFESSIYKIENINEMSILTFSRSGGTDFNKVMNRIQENGNNSVIITDGFDGCRIYDKKAFWVGVGGTTFEGYGGDDGNAFNSFRKNRQCVAYNSQTSNFDYCTDEYSR